MKKLLKSVVCGTYEQCTGALFMGEKSKSYSLEKKKNLKRKRVSGKRASQTHHWNISIMKGILDRKHDIIILQRQSTFAFDNFPPLGPHALVFSYNGWGKELLFRKLD